MTNVVGCFVVRGHKHGCLSVAFFFFSTYHPRLFLHTVQLQPLVYLSTMSPLPHQQYTSNNLPNSSFLIPHIFCTSTAHATRLHQHLTQGVHSPARR
ncbi:hypothetical protein HBI25_145190 [Parastagonospora nodorum]|nr:hypothetical protein HBH51_072930 [Parastagonospora nodorum]KAH4007677.1 hypothetical protein HBI10_000790 [Parastagonospora nodorum]KAH4016478.1 hypothetical protein HBI13_148810 [Parastagonospora nodorum]KAH4040718.1 hypothetical protein HBI09_012990 [Parastagonospora nodorum]KAH4058726.1 hypothetical protein HBH49_036890 [Parastagonospora nodorum]